MTAYTERDDTRREEKSNKLLKYKTKEEAAKQAEDMVHAYRRGKKVICDTDTRGFKTPEGRDMTEIVVDSSEGFIPLWDSDVTLRWRFQELALVQFENDAEIKSYVRGLMAEGILLWEDAAPIKFKEAQDAWDFEVVIMAENKCRDGGCTLASAFFPDAGRHQLRIYPRMFQQSLKEQKETMAHEIGHIFGLRHFFADVRETAWPVEIFGAHEAFSIMNYGHHSEMTKNDRDDLKTLYCLARARELTHINGTPIRLVRPFSAMRTPNVGLELIAAREVPVRPQGA